MRAWRGRTPRPRATTGLWSTTRLGKSHPRPSPRPPRRGESPGPCLKLASSWTTVPALPPARRPRRDEARRPSPPAARATRRSTRTTSSKRRCDPPRARAPRRRVPPRRTRRGERRRPRRRDKHRVTDLRRTIWRGKTRRRKRRCRRRASRRAAETESRRCASSSAMSTLSDGDFRRARRGKSRSRGRAAHHGRACVARSVPRTRSADARRRVETPEPTNGSASSLDALLAPSASFAPEPLGTEAGPRVPEPAPAEETPAEETPAEETPAPTDDLTDNFVWRDDEREEDAAPPEAVPVGPAAPDDFVWRDDAAPAGDLEGRGGEGGDPETTTTTTAEPDPRLSGTAEDAYADDFEADEVDAAAAPAPAPAPAPPPVRSARRSPRRSRRLR